MASPAMLEPGEVILHLSQNQHPPWENWGWGPGRVSIFASAETKAWRRVLPRRAVWICSWAPDSVHTTKQANKTNSNETATIYKVPFQATHQFISLWHWSGIARGSGNIFAPVAERQKKALIFYGRHDRGSRWPLWLLLLMKLILDTEL